MDDTYTPKARYYDRAEDRIGPYRTWRYGLGDGLYVCDFDQTEYTVVNDEVEVVGFIEVTQCRTVLEAHGLLDKIWDRLDPDGEGRSSLQTKAMRYVAKKLGVPALVVVHQKNGDRFAVRRFDDRQFDDGWHKYGSDGYIGVIKWLRRRHTDGSTT